MIRLFSLTSVCCFLILAAIAPAHVFAQDGLDVYVTPIPKAPFSGTILAETTMNLSTSSVATFETIRAVGRDSKGRIYNEYRSFLPAGSKETPGIMTVHLYDPRTRISTVINHINRTYRTGTVEHPPETVSAAIRYARAASSGSTAEDLGNRVMDGVPVHGIRISKTFPATRNGSLKETVVTDEYWYSEDLRINMVIKHNDPRTGGFTFTVTQVNRTEPDSGRFKIPEGFTLRQEVQPPPAPSVFSDSVLGFQYTPPSNLRNLTKPENQLIRQMTEETNMIEGNVHCLLSLSSGADATAAAWHGIEIRSYPSAKVGKGLSHHDAASDFSNWVSGTGVMSKPADIQIDGSPFFVSDFELKEGQVTKHVRVYATVLKGQALAFVFSANSARALNRIVGSIKTFKHI